MIVTKSKIYQFIANVLTPVFHEYRLWDRKNYWLRKAKLKIGNNVAIGEHLYVLKTCESNIEIDDYTSIGDFAKFWAFNKVYIGKFSTIAADVHFINGGHKTDSFEPYSKPLRVGHGCWIGNGVKILKGVTIGNNVVIGGGSVVIDDIPDNAIAIGIPAKVIKYRELSDKVWHLGNDYFCPKTFELIK